MGREGWSQRRGEGFVFHSRVGDGRASRVGARSHSPYDHVIVHLLHHLDELLIRDEELGVEPAMVRARHRASPNPRARCLEGCRCHAEVLREKGRWVVRLDASRGRVSPSARGEFAALRRRRDVGGARSLTLASPSGPLARFTPPVRCVSTRQKIPNSPSQLEQNPPHDEPMLRLGRICRLWSFS